AGRFHGGARRRRGRGRPPSRIFVMQYARPIRPPDRMPAWSPGRSRGGGEPVVPAAVAAGLLPPVRVAGWLRCRMTAAAGAGRGGGSLGGTGSLRGSGGLRGSAAREAGRDTGRPGGDRAEPPVDAVVERLDAERVPGAEQLAGPGVPDGERVHAA